MPGNYVPGMTQSLADPLASLGTPLGPVMRPESMPLPRMTGLASPTMERGHDVLVTQMAGSPAPGGPVFYKSSPPERLGLTSVDLPGMTAAQPTFEQALGMLNTAYSDMSEQQANLAAHWQGETSSAFGAALSAWLDDMHTVRQQLARIVETLAKHTGLYANTQESSQQVATAFQNGMSGITGLGI
jgi:WXG100 family type VII secretion target